MDAFYASVELIDRPELRGQPVIVGAGGGRGVVLSATYEARRMGVHSAMPMSRARRLCPSADVIAPDHARYSEVSKNVMEVFRSITPEVEPLSLDEAFLDVSGAVRRLGSPTEIARRIRAQVEHEQRITCSVGVASTKFVAKLASSRCKPDGLLVVPAAQTIEYLHPLPVGALWGVGEKTAEQLHRLGLRTVGEIAHTPRATLVRALGQASGNHLHELAWGREPAPWCARSPRRASAPRRRSAPTSTTRRWCCASCCGSPSAPPGGCGGPGCRGARSRSRCGSPTSPRSPARARCPRPPTWPARSTPARGLYEALHLERARIRLVGVRVEGLVEAGGQHRQLMLDERPQGWREAEQAGDRAVARFGSHSVRPASLLERGDGPRRPRPPRQDGPREDGDAPPAR